MSRPLVALALLALALAGLAPILVMLGRMDGGDLALLGQARTLGLLGRTLAVGGGAALLALALGLPYGFLVARSDLPGASVLRPLGLVPLLLPPLVFAMSWVVLVDLRGWAMIVLLLGFGGFPIVAMFAAKAWEHVDARREEAALLVGGLPAVLRMELPLVLPPALCGACLAFVFAIHEFSVPDYVSSVGARFNVYADEVFFSWKASEDDGRAVAVALPLVAVTLLALLPALALRRRGAMATIDRDFQRPAPLALGRWRWPALAFCLTVVALGALVPLGRLAYEAGGGARGFSVATLRASFAMALDRSGEDLAATVGFATGAATLAVPVGLVLGHAFERARRGRLLEWTSVLPLAVPAVLFGVGNIVLWNRPLTSDFYASGAMVVVMLFGRFVAFPALVGSGAVAALDPRLEEAAELAGARPARRLFTIVAPSLWLSLAGGWAVVFVLCMRELDASIFVPAANRMVMFRVYNGVHFGRDAFVAATALLIVFVIIAPGLLWTLFARKRLEVLP